jgi:hypothetical protein
MQIENSYGEGNQKPHISTDFVSPRKLWICDNGAFESCSEVALTGNDAVKYGRGVGALSIPAVVVILHITGTGKQGTAGW